ncbi:pentapeptide repeat-containing protein [Calothrix sp. FACHB-1219]|uniref:pentapeptide repeat-containing protein n=1 Tax=unclassified Calothrix TaxID=2619626 RepID=UPI0016893F09|nr:MULTISPECIES: pentapeptide repeat-containing protein [unclassified Calothrix]MBD2207813.1 pentapeptide repeat-containing protein [Calothrix sp. FACHB-168]MBD2222356.1 pentapeptide repeat-containing protein [Calothrix sp. FACHB-1219]
MKTDRLKRKANRIHGKRFVQNDLLNANFQNQIAGQKILIKNTLAAMSILLSILANVLSGYVGGFISLYSIIDNPARSQLHITLVIVLAVIATSITQDVIKVTLTLIISLGVAIILSILLAAFNLIQGFTAFLITIIVATGLCLGLSLASFLTVRFTIAVADILFINSKLLKISIVSSSIFPATISCLGVIADVLERKSLAFSEILLTSPVIYWTVLSLGAGYGVSLTLSAWLANSVRGTPWLYPELQRFWALTVGSWWGTSFVNLDLSNINFRNAKLANSDLRARKLYRTCFQGAIGLERARVDNQYLDLEIPKVQKLLTHACSADRDFRGFNLQGAYLQGADLRGFDFTDTNLTGADLKQADLRESRLVRTQLAGADFQGVDLRKNVLIDANLTEADFQKADLRGSIFVRAQVARANFRGADLTGICIEDWSVSNKTCFTDVRCDYIYRKYDDNQPTDRYPVDRDFEAGEFAYLYQESEDVVELVFKGEFDFSALSLAFYKLQTEMPELEFELKGIEQRENLWVVKAKTKGSVTERLIEAQLNLTYQATARESTVETTIRDSIYRDYEEIKARLAASEQLVNRLAGVTGDQAEALKELSKRSLGNSFFITGSTITNLAGSGQIEYTEAADQIRQVMTNSSDPKQVTSILQGLITQFKQQNVATTVSTQLELIQQIIGVEAEKDPEFKQLLIEQSQQVIGSMPKGEVATAVEAAIAQLRV